MRVSSEHADSLLDFPLIVEGALGGSDGAGVEGLR